MERRWGSDLTVFVAPPTGAGAVPWWLLLLSSACLWCPRSSRPVLLRRTVLKPQLLLLVTCMGEANTLRKSRWKGELLLVKAQLQVFHRDGRRRTQ